MIFDMFYKALSVVLPPHVSSTRMPAHAQCPNGVMHLFW
jgi:hypothetical protein